MFQKVVALRVQRHWIAAQRSGLTWLLYGRRARKGAIVKQRSVGMTWELILTRRRTQHSVPSCSSEVIVCFLKSSKEVHFTKNSHFWNSKDLMRSETNHVSHSIPRNFPSIYLTAFKFPSTQNSICIISSSQHSRPIKLHDINLIHLLVMSLICFNLNYFFSTQTPNFCDTYRWNIFFFLMWKYMRK